MNKNFTTLLIIVSLFGIFKGGNAIYKIYTLEKKAIVNEHKEGVVKRAEIYDNKKCIEQCFYSFRSVLSYQEKSCYQTCIIADSLEKLAKELKNDN